MYKDKTKQRAVERDRQRRYRKGVTSSKGVTGAEAKSVTLAEGVTSVSKLEGMEGVTPDIILKLTDPWWRDRIQKICSAFDHSHHSEYKEDCWLGDTNLSLACDWLECTR